MIKTNCDTCSKVLLRSPSKIGERNYCSRKCYSKTRNNELIRRGKKSRFKVGDKSISKNQPAGDKHSAWKGERVGYRGLHQWIIRRKGKPCECSNCGKKDTRPRIIQWANIDGRYKRNLDDYVALCSSCHKKYDLKIASTQGEPVAT